MLSNDCSRYKLTRDARALLELSIGNGAEGSEGDDDVEELHFDENVDWSVDRVVVDLLIE